MLEVCLEGPKRRGTTGASILSPQPLLPAACVGMSPDGAPYRLASMLIPNGLIPLASPIRRQATSI